VYQQVELILKNEEIRPLCDVYLSYDEKPGIQAIENTASDLPPVPGEQHPAISRDSEYKRRGTLSVLAAIDLVTGQVIGSVEERHRSKEFVEFLKQLDAHYQPHLRIQIILDNHSAHTSKETEAYLASVPDRFDFVFTPKHGSRLNVIESFFAKMTKQVLRHIRVKSKEELKKRIELYLQEVNENPACHSTLLVHRPKRWRYSIERWAVKLLDIAFDYPLPLHEGFLLPPPTSQRIQRVGTTLYYGAATAKCTVCQYDKAKQLNDVYAMKSVSPITRVEFRFKPKLKPMTEYTFKDFESMSRYHYVPDTKGLTGFRVELKHFTVGKSNWKQLERF